MLLIGLGHRARQGKDTVANYMKLQDNRVKIYSLAEELKKYCALNHDALIVQWRREHPNTQPAFKEDPIYGWTSILQWYGTDVARRHDPGTWIKILDSRFRSEKPQFAVVTDIRYPNEAEYIKQNGGYMVNVIRQNNDGSQFISNDRDPNHPSEVSLNEYEGYDFIIEALDGDLKTLKRKSIGVLNAIDAIEKGESWVFVDEPDYAQDIYSHIEADDDGTGFKY